MVGLTTAISSKVTGVGGGGGGVINSISLNFQRCMRHFMGLFFVTFSMIKFVNLSTFVDVFEKYDLVTKQW